jgi:hypothetical protein
MKSSDFTDVANGVAGRGDRLGFSTLLEWRPCVGAHRSVWSQWCIVLVAQPWHWGWSCCSLVCTGDVTQRSRLVCVFCVPLILRAVAECSSSSRAPARLGACIDLQQHPLPHQPAAAAGLSVWRTCRDTCNLPSHLVFCNALKPGGFQSCIRVPGRIEANGVIQGSPKALGGQDAASILPVSC